MEEKVYSKQAEKRAIKELAEMGGYFAATFSNDIERICNNIDKDFPFEYGTKVYEELADRKDELAAGNAALERGVKYLCTNMLQFNHELNTNTLAGRSIVSPVLEVLGMEKTVLLKHELKIPLSESEIDWLIEKIKK